MFRGHTAPKVLAPLLLVVLALSSACAPEGGEPTPEAGAGASPGSPAPRDVALPEGAEAISFLGDTLFIPTLPEAVQADRLARFQEAEGALESDPEGADALIWMGRRTAYLGRYRDAIDIYGYALTLHPDDARLYRHRGHRYVSVRELDAAIADFRRAVALTRGRPDEVEPDGQPNALGIPTSTLQFNIWYHLGLAYYLKGDFEAAADAYDSCAAVSVHPDSKVATAYWRVMTLKRLGRTDEAETVLAEIGPDEEVIESGGYLDLLLLHKGEKTAEDLIGPAGSDATLESTTSGYGVGMWYLLNGDEAEARRIFTRVRSGRDQWAAFGFLAAEAELARMGAR
ncbi:MAG TPA: tetratricopeptide repeat protein [Longimicrobiales bacterium]|nr:tetratricopeptide repeat protein [Longimicrobiales bacterium]